MSDTFSNTFCLSPLDQRILSVLQRDGRLSNQEVADRVGSSASSVWRRLRAMTQARVVTGFHLAVDAQKLGYGQIVFLHVSLHYHSEENTADFTDFIAHAPEVLECYATTGEFDYMVKVLATDMRGYHQFLERSIMRKSYIQRTSSTVIMQTVKQITTTPIGSDRHGDNHE